MAVRSVAIALAAVGAAGQADYGSYIANCDATSAQVTFVNYPHRDCKGVPSDYSKPLNQCLPEEDGYTWNAFCNATNIWYQNFAGAGCKGKSVVTRTYPTHKCENCPDATCKSPHMGNMKVEATAQCEMYRRIENNECADSCLDDPVGVCPRSIIVTTGKLEAGDCASASYTVPDGEQSQAAGPCGTLTFKKYKKPSSAEDPDYGSYIANCDATSKQVTFVNYPHRDCQGAPSDYSKPLNQCLPEEGGYSWNAFCNATNIWYQNFVGAGCTGKSVQTRTYPTHKCANCLNASCKSPHMSADSFPAVVVV